MILKLGVVAPLIASLLAGCSAEPKSQSEPEHRGVPNDQAALVLPTEYEGGNYWQASAASLADTYRKRVYLEAPRIMVAEGSGLDFTATEVDGLLLYFQRQLRRELLANGYELVGQPEAQALRIRLTVTGLKRQLQGLTTGECSGCARGHAEIKGKLGHSFCKCMFINKFNCGALYQI